MESPQRRVSLGEYKPQRRSSRSMLSEGTSMDSATIGVQNSESRLSFSALKSPTLLTHSTPGSIFENYPVPLQKPGDNLRKSSSSSNISGSSLYNIEETKDSTAHAQQEDIGADDATIRSHANDKENLQRFSELITPSPSPKSSFFDFQTPQETASTPNATVSSLASSLSTSSSSPLSSMQSYDKGHQPSYSESSSRLPDILSSPTKTDDKWKEKGDNPLPEKGGNSAHQSNTNDETDDSQRVRRKSKFMSRFATDYFTANKTGDMDSKPNTLSVNESTTTKISDQTVSVDILSTTKPPTQDSQSSGITSFDSSSKRRDKESELINKPQPLESVAVFDCDKSRIHSDDRYTSDIEKQVNNADIPASRFTDRSQDNGQVSADSDHTPSTPTGTSNKGGNQSVKIEDQSFVGDWYDKPYESLETSIVKEGYSSVFTQPIPDKDSHEKQHKRTSDLNGTEPTPTFKTSIQQQQQQQQQQKLPLLQQQCENNSVNSNNYQLPLLNPLENNATTSSGTDKVTPSSSPLSVFTTSRPQPTSNFVSFKKGSYIKHPYPSSSSKDKPATLPAQTYPTTDSFSVDHTLFAPIEPYPKTTTRRSSHQFLSDGLLSNPVPITSDILEPKGLTRSGSSILNLESNRMSSVTNKDNDDGNGDDNTDGVSSESKIGVTSNQDRFSSNLYDTDNEPYKEIDNGNTYLTNARLGYSNSTVDSDNNTKRTTSSNRFTTLNNSNNNHSTTIVPSTSSGNSQLDSWTSRTDRRSSATESEMVDDSMETRLQKLPSEATDQRDIRTRIRELKYKADLASLHTEGIKASPSNTWHQQSGQLTKDDDLLGFDPEDPNSDSLGHLLKQLTQTSDPQERCHIRNTIRHLRQEADSERLKKSPVSRVNLLPTRQTTSGHYDDPSPGSYRAGEIAELSYHDNDGGQLKHKSSLTSFSYQTTNENDRGKTRSVDNNCNEINDRRDIDDKGKGILDRGTPNYSTTTSTTTTTHSLSSGRYYGSNKNNDDDDVFLPSSNYQGTTNNQYTHSNGASSSESLRKPQSSLEEPKSRFGQITSPGLLQSTSPSQSLVLEQAKARLRSRTSNLFSDSRKLASESIDKSPKSPLTHSLIDGNNSLLVSPTLHRFPDQHNKSLHSLHKTQEVGKSFNKSGKETETASEKYRELRRCILGDRRHSGDKPVVDNSKTLHSLPESKSHVKTDSNPSNLESPSLTSTSLPLNKSSPDISPGRNHTSGLPSPLSSSSFQIASHRKSPSPRLVRHEAFKFPSGGHLSDTKQSSYSPKRQDISDIPTSSNRSDKTVANFNPSVSQPYNKEIPGHRGITTDSNTREKVNPQLTTSQLHLSDNRPGADREKFELNRRDDKSYTGSNSSLSSGLKSLSDRRNHVNTLDDRRSDSDRFGEFGQLTKGDKLQQPGKHIVGSLVEKFSEFREELDLSESKLKTFGLKRAESFKSGLKTSLKTETKDSAHIYPSASSFSSSFSRANVYDDKKKPLEVESQYKPHIRQPKNTLSKALSSNSLFLNSEIRKTTDKEKKCDDPKKPIELVEETIVEQIIQREKGKPDEPKKPVKFIEETIVEQREKGKPDEPKKPAEFVEETIVKQIIQREKGKPDEPKKPVKFIEETIVKQIIQREKGKPDEPKKPVKFVEETIVEQIIQRGKGKPAEPKKPVEFVEETIVEQREKGKLDEPKKPVKFVEETIVEQREKGKLDEPKKPVEFVEETIVKQIIQRESLLPTYLSKQKQDVTIGLEFSEKTQDNQKLLEPKPDSGSLHNKFVPLADETGNYSKEPNRDNSNFQVENERKISEAKIEIAPRRQRKVGIIHISQPFGQSETSKDSKPTFAKTSEETDSYKSHETITDDLANENERTDNFQTENSDITVSTSSLLKGENFSSTESSPADQPIKNLIPSEIHPVEKPTALARVSSIDSLAERVKRFSVPAFGLHGANVSRSGSKPGVKKSPLTSFTTSSPAGSPVPHRRQSEIHNRQPADTMEEAFSNLLDDLDHISGQEDTESSSDLDLSDTDSDFATLSEGSQGLQDNSENKDRDIVISSSSNVTEEFIIPKNMTRQNNEPKLYNDYKTYKQSKLLRNDNNDELDNKNTKQIKRQSRDEKKNDSLISTKLVIDKNGNNSENKRRESQKYRDIAKEDEENMNGGEKEAQMTSTSPRLKALSSLDSWSKEDSGIGLGLDESLMTSYKDDVKPRVPSSSALPSSSSSTSSSLSSTPSPLSIHPSTTTEVPQPEASPSHDNIPDREVSVNQVKRAIGKDQDKNRDAVEKGKESTAKKHNTKPKDTKSVSMDQVIVPQQATHQDIDPVKSTNSNTSSSSFITDKSNNNVYTKSASHQNNNNNNNDNNNTIGTRSFNVSEESDGSFTVRAAVEDPNQNRVVTVRTKKQRTPSNADEELKDTIVERKIFSRSGSVVEEERDVIQTKKRLTHRGSNYYQRNAYTTKTLRNRNGEVIEHDVSVEYDNTSVSQGQSWADKVTTKVIMGDEKSAEFKAKVDGDGVDLATSGSSGYGTTNEDADAKNGEKDGQSSSSAASTPLDKYTSLEEDLILSTSFETNQKTAVHVQKTHRKSEEDASRCISADVVCEASVTDLRTQRLVGASTETDYLINYTNRSGNDQHGDYNDDNDDDECSDKSVDEQYYDDDIKNYQPIESMIEKGHKEVSYANSDDDFTTDDDDDDDNYNDDDDDDDYSDDNEVDGAMNASSNSRQRFQQQQSGNQRHQDRFQKSWLFLGSRVSPPEIVQPLKDVTVTEGKPIVLECRIMGKPHPEITWYKDEELVEESDDYVIRFDAEMGKATLLIGCSTLFHTAKFTCQGHNAAGNAQTQCRALVKRRPTHPPVFEKRLTDVNVTEGHSTMLVCEVTDAGGVAWYKDGIVQRNSSDFKQTFDGHTARLEIGEVFLDDVGQYSCVAKNEVGEEKTSCQLSVDACTSETIVVPMFLNKLSNPVVNDGDRLELECDVIGSPEPSISWLKQGEPLGSGDLGFSTSYDGRVARLVVESLRPEDAGRYTCVAQNPAGKVSMDSNVTVQVKNKAPYFIEKMEHEITTKLRENIMLKCEIAGSPPPVVLWRKNGILIGSASNIIQSYNGGVARLEVLGVTSQDGGIFECVGKNSVSEVTCSCLVKVEGSTANTPTSSAPSLPDQSTPLPPITRRRTFKKLSEPRPKDVISAVLLRASSTPAVQRTQSFSPSSSSSFNALSPTSPLSSTLSSSANDAQPPSFSPSTSSASSASPSRDDQSEADKPRRTSSPITSSSVPKSNNAQSSVAPQRPETLQVTRHSMTIPPQSREKALESSRSFLSEKLSPRIPSSPSSSSSTSTTPRSVPVTRSASMHVLRSNTFNSQESPPSSNQEAPKALQFTTSSSVTEDESSPREITSGRSSSYQNLTQLSPSTSTIPGYRSVSPSFLNSPGREKLTASPLATQTSESISTGQEGEKVTDSKTASVNSKHNDALTSNLKGMNSESTSTLTTKTTVSSPSKDFKEIQQRETATTSSNHLLSPKSSSLSSHLSSSTSSLSSTEDRFQPKHERLGEKSGSVHDRFQNRRDDPPPQQQQRISTGRLVSPRVSELRQQFLKNDQNAAGPPKPSEGSSGGTSLRRWHSLPPQEMKPQIIKRDSPGYRATTEPTTTSTTTTNSSTMPSYENMNDEEELHTLMNKTEDFEERKKIRARLREIRDKQREEMEAKKKERAANSQDAVKLKLQMQEEQKKLALEGFAKQATKLSTSTVSESKTGPSGQTVSKTTTTTETSKTLPGGGTRTVIQKTTETSVQSKGMSSLGKPAEQTAKELTEQLMRSTKAGGTSGHITVKTESWNSSDGMVNRSQKTQSWGGGGGGGGAAAPANPMNAFKQMDNAANPGAGAAKPNYSTARKDLSTKQEDEEGGLVAVSLAKRAANNMRRNAVAIKQEILYFCQMNTKEYENVAVTNFSNSWNNGMAFCALIHHFFPDAFDFAGLNPKARRFNFTLAFDTAEKRADIAPLLDVDDMVKMKNPDWKCVFTYVQSIYRHLRDHENNKVMPCPVASAEQ